MGEARNRSKRRAKRGSRHEVRVWLGKDLYDRLSREAAARELNLSQCIRELLGSHFELEREWSPPWESSSIAPDVPAAQSLFEALAERLTEPLREREENLAAIDTSVRTLAAMIQQAYLGVVARLPPIPESERAERHEAARRALDAWSETVLGVVRSGGASVFDDASGSSGEY